jgi:hypothetical protein
LLLVKETLLFITGPCLLVALYVEAMRRRDLAKAGILAGAAALGGLGCAVIWMACLGGVRIPLLILRGAAQNNASLPYALEWMTGPGYLLLAAFHGLSPLTINLAAQRYAMSTRTLISRWLPECCCYSHWGTYRCS